MCKKKGPTNDFCWNCLKDWKSLSKDVCGNDNCDDKKSKTCILKNCGTKNISSDIQNIPEFRACPKCL